MFVKQIELLQGRIRDLNVEVKRLQQRIGEAEVRISTDGKLIERQREALKDLVEAIAGTVQINDTQLAGAYRRAKAMAGERE